MIHNTPIHDNSNNKLQTFLLVAIFLVLGIVFVTFMAALNKERLQKEEMQTEYSSQQVDNHKFTLVASDKEPEDETIADVQDITTKEDKNKEITNEKTNFLGNIPSQTFFLFLSLSLIVIIVFDECRIYKLKKLLKNLQETIKDKEMIDNESEKIQSQENDISV